MPKAIENMKNSIGSGIRYFFINLLEIQSMRTKMVFATFFAWLGAIFYYGFFISFVREVTAIYYRQACIANAVPVNLDNNYGGTILSMTSAAFLAALGGYISSNWDLYKNNSKNNPGVASDIGQEAKDKKKAVVSSDSSDDDDSKPL